MFKKRYIIIDQDEKFTMVASSILEMSDGFTFVNSYTCCEDAIKHLKKDLPDIVIMDLDFAQMKGPEAIDIIKRMYPKIEILVVTDYTDYSIVLKVVTLGIAGFLSKRNCLLSLSESLRSIIEGGAPIDSMIARKLLDNLKINTHSVLSTRETEVLNLITTGKSYSKIASELNISPETSKTHIKNIYSKLNVNSKSQAVKKAISERLVISIE